MPIKIKQLNHDLLFRLGLGFIFLANALTAWFSPAEFKELIANNYLASRLASPNLLISFIGINDGLLFLLIAFGKWRKFVAIWATLWLLVVIYVTGIRTPDFIEHLGILFIIGYYFTKTPKQGTVEK
ncbi:MAG: DoxX family membrane protein [Patescibacteria group bacterium]|nr:DoxX family membrane protein [Patescibacteria group bacterium]